MEISSKPAVARCRTCNEWDELENLAAIISHVSNGLFPYRTMIYLHPGRMCG